jgi:hypothetical protein
LADDKDNKKSDQSFNLGRIIASDGYADGGEPYTEEELAIINNKHHVRSFTGAYMDKDFIDCKCKDCINARQISFNESVKSERRGG